MVTLIDIRTIGDGVYEVVLEDDGERRAYPFSVRKTGKAHDDIKTRPPPEIYSDYEKYAPQGTEDRPAGILVLDFVEVLLHAVRDFHLDRLVKLPMTLVDDHGVQAQIRFRFSG